MSMITMEQVIEAGLKGTWTPELREAAVALIDAERRFTVRALLFDYACCESDDEPQQRDIQRRFRLIKRMKV